MDLFTRDELRRLAQMQDEVCISLYLPTHRYESEGSQNPTRFKNVVREARGDLRDMGYHDDEIDTLLAEAHRQTDDSAFWRSMSEGLAVFITPSTTEFFRLPLSFDELAVVGSRFHLKPLFPLIATNNRFYLLALSQNDVRLYQGTHQSVSEVESAEIPASIVEAIRQYEDPEKQIQVHTSNRAEGGGATQSDAQFHGQGGSSDDLSAEPQSELKRFFRKIDDRVATYLNGEKAPLVLAGVSEYLPLYAEVSDYPHLVDDQIIAGNPEPMGLDELHEKAWSVVEPIFLEAQDDALGLFDQLYYQDGELASDDFHEIVPACAYSRVDTLFVPVGQYRWGTFDADANTVELHDEQKAGDEDLLDYAAVTAYLNGSTVHALRPENMPGGRSVAATFRFRADVSATENG
jgi:hypothetical protein